MRRIDDRGAGALESFDEALQNADANHGLIALEKDRGFDVRRERGQTHLHRRAHPLLPAPVHRWLNLQLSEGRQHPLGSVAHHDHYGVQLCLHGNTGYVRKQRRAVPVQQLFRPAEAGRAAGSQDNTRDPAHPRSSCHGVLHSLIGRIVTERGAGGNARGEAPAAGRTALSGCSAVARAFRSDLRVRARHGIVCSTLLCP